MTRRWARLATCCLAAALVWACGPVYIPVPPPMQTTFTRDTLTDSQGRQTEVWIAAGGPEPTAAFAVYYIFDDDRNAGVIAQATEVGSYQAPPMEGTAGDRILINYKDTRGKFSASACVILGEEHPPLRCP